MKVIIPPWLFTIKEDRVNTAKRLGKKSNITLKKLRLTEKD